MSRHVADPVLLQISAKEKVGGAGDLGACAFRCGWCGYCMHLHFSDIGPRTVEGVRNGPQTSVGAVDSPLLQVARARHGAHAGGGDGRSGRE